MAVRELVDVGGSLLGFAAVLWLVVAVGGALSDAIAPEVAASEPTPPPCGPVRYVEDGDTFWTIAKRCYPSKPRDWRPVVDELQAANPGVDAGKLRVLQPINIPEGWR